MATELPMHAPMYDITYVTWQSEYEKERPFMLFLDVPEGATDRRKTNVVYKSQPTRVEDLREHHSKLEPECGFKVVDATEAESWSDPNDFEEKYIPFVKDLLSKEVPDAGDMFILDWRRSAASKSEDGERFNLKDATQFLLPASVAHIDQCPMEALKFVKKKCKSDRDFNRIRRARIINVWRPIRHNVYDWPLAVCDARSVDNDKILEIDQVYPSLISTPMFLQHMDSYRWYYLSEQKPSEALIFTQFDSEQDGINRSVPHAAFNVLGGKNHEHGRESVEVRVLMLNFEE